MVLTVKALLVALLLGGALLVLGLGLRIPLPGVAAMAAEALLGLMLPPVAFPLFFAGVVFLFCIRPGDESGGGLKVGRVITCTNGPLQERSYPLTKREATLTFGRNGCDVLFPQGTPGVSGNHCRVTLKGETAFLMDDGSSYGTFLLPDGQRLIPGQPVQLRDGMQFCLASPAVAFRYSETASRTAGLQQPQFPRT